MREVVYRAINRDMAQNTLCYILYGRDKLSIICSLTATLGLLLYNEPKTSCSDDQL